MNCFYSKCFPFSYSLNSDSVGEFNTLYHFRSSSKYLHKVIFNTWNLADTNVEQILFSRVLFFTSNKLVDLADSCLSSRFIWIITALYFVCVVLACIATTDGQQTDILLGGLTHWLLAVRFRRGEDWITPGGSQGKTGAASLTLRPVMTKTEVSGSQVGECKRVMKEWGKGGKWKGAEEGTGVMEKYK